MIKKLMLTLCAVTVAGLAAQAQNGKSCASDQFHKEQMALHPQIAIEEAKLQAAVNRYMSGKAPATSSNAKTAFNASDETVPWTQDVTEYHIPVVFHIIYDNAGAAAAVTDNQIYEIVKRINTHYNRTDPKLSAIINPFQQYIGNPHITFHLANKDPNGKPTRGIVREYSYSTNGGDESAKISQWPPNQYLNIYLENYIGRGAGKGIVQAYATFPTDYSSNPYSQGVISRADQVNYPPTFGDEYTITHEIGHFLYLYHPWNNNGKEVEDTLCGDDEVDDTPPTVGHFSCSSAKLYDTTCAKGYFKDYDAITAYHMFGDSSAASRHKDYPDTTNTQNIMDYSACPDEMFSKGQVGRMRTALRSDVGNRSNLMDTANLIKTGVMDGSGNFVPPTDIPPTALFTLSRPFTCANSSSGVIFTNRSYNDTIATASWTFDKSPNPTSSSTTTVSNTFSDTGWVTTSLTVTGNGAGGSDTYTRNDLLYVADPNPIDPNYIEDFNPSEMRGHFPIFNYFGNPNYKWQLSDNAGFYDKTSIKFSNYDPRDQFAVTSGQAVNLATESPRGLYADFYTPAYDLSAFGGNCFLDFYSAGAYRTTKTSNMNDTLLISYSSNCGVTWSKLGVIARGDLANNGYRPEAFEPTYMGEWKEQSLSMPTAARTNQIYFRFRYLPGTDNAYLRYSGLDFGTGNNFYMDRIGVTSNPLSVKNGMIVKLGMSILPNPTSGAAIIRLNGGDNSTADVNVTDVTGKLVYHTSVVRKNTTTEIEIPATAIIVKGMYLVHVVTNGATETQKLVAY